MNVQRPAGRSRFAIPVGRSVRPDLVVLDTALPDGDGVETYEGLRAAGVHAPVLFPAAGDSAREDTGATYVHYLRRKLGDHDRALIRTVRGIGYTMPRD